MFIIIDTEEIRILNILRFPRASVEPLRATPYASYRSLFSRDVQDVLVSALPHDVAVLADQESSYIQDASYCYSPFFYLMKFFSSLGSEDDEPPHSQKRSLRGLIASPRKAECISEATV